ncbi:DNA primase [Coxiella-like endosymbiont]|uniref:DNA primase n=1 Tax=Coxiella-like endosymbiont TaxID=1592897 RepID=UPI00272A04B6|nr:DNA primase [Coxiella-like endosymbiont]
MRRIPQSFIQDLLSRIDIVELIQSRVSLKKRGRNYLGLCPFHNEKTPSFTVSPAKQFYYCFGCGASGNAINFLMAFDRTEFVETITDLSAQFSLEISLEARHSNSPKQEEYYSLLAKIARYYQQQLKRSPIAINYLKSRGLTGEIAKQFALGYAPSNWENLKAFTKNSKIKVQLITNGLLIKKDHRLFDRFRHRIIFPIRDVQSGRIIAFGGRALGNDQPKYMNSPETPIFHKGNELYGLYEARKKQANLSCFLIVEGYMDVISLHQHQIPYAVATMGTATNTQHLKKLLRYVNEIVYCFDGDNAGRRAAWRALTESLPLMRDGIHIRFLFLPEEEDPDSLIRKIGKDAFEAKIKAALPLSEVFFEHLQREIPLHSIADKANFAKKALEYLNTMPKGLFYQLLIKELAKRLAVEIDEIHSLIEDNEDNSEKGRTSPNHSSSPSQVLSLAYHAISILAQIPSLVALIPKDFLPISISNMPDMQLLFKVVTLLTKQQINSTAELLALWPDSQEHQLIADLVGRRLLEEARLSTDDLAIELKDAIQRLKEQAEKEKTWQLLRRKNLKKELDETVN